MIGRREEEGNGRGRKEKGGKGGGERGNLTLICMSLLNTWCSTFALIGGRKREGRGGEGGREGGREGGGKMGGRRGYVLSTLTLF
jgi:hypothetical protein